MEALFDDLSQYQPDLVLRMKAHALTMIVQDVVNRYVRGDPWLFTVLSPKDVAGGRTTAVMVMCGSQRGARGVVVQHAASAVQERSGQDVQEDASRQRVQMRGQHDEGYL